MGNGLDTSGIPDKHILVLGGAGYLGSVLVRKLLRLKYTVTVYDDFLYGTQSLSSLDRSDFFHIIKGDIRDHEKLRKIVPGKNIIVNLAAIVGDEACELDREATKDINSASNEHIFGLAEDFGVERFIFASTCSVYGFSDSVLKENSFFSPVSLYAQTKLTSELLLLALSQKYKTSLNILRFATLFGWSYRPRFDLVVNTMTSSAIANKKVVVYGGDQWRPHLHVLDAADAVIRLIEAPLSRVRGEIFNVGSNELNMTILALARKIASFLPTCRLEHMRDASDPRNYKVDFSKIAAQLDFKTRYNIQDGVREIFREFNRGKVANFQEPIYSNVRQLEMNKQLALAAAKRSPEYSPLGLFCDK